MSEQTDRDRERLVEVILENMVATLPAYRKLEAGRIADAVIADGWVRIIEYEKEECQPESDL